MNGRKGHCFAVLMAFGLWAVFARLAIIREGQAQRAKAEWTRTNGAFEGS